MNKLMKLELKRNRLKPYLLAIAIITVISLGLLYLFAAIPYMNVEDSDAFIFGNYSNLFAIIALIQSACFSVLAAVMSAKIVVEEYTGKKAILLFSYPISRAKVLQSKNLIINGFVFVGYVVSTALIFGIFLSTEQVFPLIAHRITGHELVTIFLSILLFAVISCSIGIISMRVGYYRKSTIATIVTSIVVFSILSQITTAAMGSIVVPLTFALFAGVISVLVLLNLSKWICKMEVL